MKKPSKMKKIVSADKKAVKHLKEDNKDCIAENKDHNQLIKKLNKASNGKRK